MHDLHGLSRAHCEPRETIYILYICEMFLGCPVLRDEPQGNPYACLDLLREAYLRLVTILGVSSDPWIQ